MKKKLIYVAGPISKGDLMENVKVAHEAGLGLLKAGWSVIVPHGSCFWGNSTVAFGFVPEVLPQGTVHDDWYGADLEIVRRCDAILRLPGESVGADGEVRMAESCGLTVYYSLEDALAAV